MALGRRQTGPRRFVVAVGGEHAIVDPAVDLEASDLRAYWDSLFDEKHLKYLPGEQPTYWQIQQLAPAQKNHVDSLSGIRVKAGFVIRAGVLGHQTFTIERDDGSIAPASQPERRDNGKLGWLAPESWLEELNPPAEVLVALMAAIIHLSEAQRPLSRPSGQPSGQPSSVSQDGAL